MDARTRRYFWTAPAIACSVAAIALAVSHRLFVAAVLLTVVVALNAIGFLVDLRRPVVGMILTLVTGASVFFVVEWFLRMQF